MHTMRCRFKKNCCISMRRSQETKLRGAVSRERFLDAEDGKACRRVGPIQDWAA